MPFAKNLEMPSPDRALPGRSTPMPTPGRHHVLDRPLTPPFPDGLEQAVFGMGCFWGAEKRFWEQPGVWTTAVGYAGGVTPNPTYHEVCSGMTGHAEVVQVTYDPERVAYDDLLAWFWKLHDPTSLNPQRADVGTQHRSLIFVHVDAQRAAATASKEKARRTVRASGAAPRSTGVSPWPRVTPTRPSSRRPATGGSRPRLGTRPRSTTPRSITSSTWPRTRAVTAAQAERA